MHINTKWKSKIEHPKKGENKTVRTAIITKDHTLYPYLFGKAGVKLKFEQALSNMRAAPVAVKEMAIERNIFPREYLYPKIKNELKS